MKAARQWRDLKNRMQSGIGYQQKDEPPSDGSMGLFCPACPQPGINLPDDWKDRYTPYVHTTVTTYIIADYHKAINSSVPLLWMVTSQQSIWDAEPERRTFRFLQEWPSWPTQIHIRLILVVERNLSRYVPYHHSCHIALAYSRSQARVTHTRPLSKPIQVGHILMLQASELPLVAMGSLFLHL